MESALAVLIVVALLMLAIWSVFWTDSLLKLNERMDFLWPERWRWPMTKWIVRLWGLLVLVIFGMVAAGTLLYR